MGNISEKNAHILQKMLSKEFYLSPLKFALYSYSWGQGDLKSFKGPRKWQADVMLEIERYLTQGLQQKTITDTFPDFFRQAIASGRGPGKSAFLGMLSHWFMSTRIGGSVWVAANGEPQLRTKTFPEIAKWVARGINSEFFDITATAVLPSKWFKEFIESEQGLGKNTRYYYIQGQLWSAENPDAFAGAHNFDGEMCLFDEASGIPEPIWTVQEGVFTENIIDRFWFAFSNPRQNTGAFYDCFHKNKDQWRTRQIDSRTVEGISTSPFEGIIAKYGEDSDEAKVEVYGQFPSVGDDQYISPRVVSDALSREHVREPHAKMVIGVDVARFGGDRTVFAIRQGVSLRKVYKFMGLDTMQVTGKVIEVMREWKPDLTLVDEGGLGGGVLDRLKEQGYNVRGVSFGSRADNPQAYFNKRAEMWGRLKEWLHTASLGSMEDNAEREDKEMRDDLTGPKYKISSSGSVQLESKQDMKKRGVRSTDCGDALALTLAYPVGDGVLSSNDFKRWHGDIPAFDLVVQSYEGAYTEKIETDKASCSVWGVFTHKDGRGVMLLDTWAEKMPYATLRTKIIKEWHSTYGAKAAKGHKPDVALVGDGLGDNMVLDLREANIVVPTYKAGASDHIERAHKVAALVAEGGVYVPESTRNKGQVVSWAQEMMDQCDRFPNDQIATVNTLTRALLFIKDNKWLEMPVADLDETDDEVDYSGSSRSSQVANPYAA